MCERPFYVIGVGRSGTTLLRLMLDGHSRLAIPGEAPWVTDVDPAAGVEGILAHARFREWRLDADVVRAAVGEREPRTWPDLVDTIFCLVATRRGKPRWGDKTPTHIDHLARLARWFPDATFVHILRDGREVAASLAAQPWGPRNAMAAAFYWRRAVGRARRLGRRLGRRYHEVRLEDLVAQPEGALRQVCTFLGESYEPAMLDYPHRVRARGGISDPAHRHLADPPTAGLRDWHAGLRPVESRAVEAVCRPVLRDLGYAVGPRSVTGWVVAGADRARGAARRWERQRQRPPPCPRGWAVAPPDFVGVGAEKAGTSWWYHLITDHPGVTRRGRPKELRYFHRMEDDGLSPAEVETYSRFFPRPEGKLAGEWTPSYMARPDIPAKLAAAAPDARLLVLLRDPVERFRSQASVWAHRHNPAPDERPPGWIRERGLYVSHLQRLFERFSPERVLILQYEACRAEPEPFLDQTYTFLGLSDGHRPWQLRRRRNVTTDKRDLPSHWERELEAFYETSVKSLARLVPDLDLRLWPHFAHLV